MREVVRDRRGSLFMALSILALVIGMSVFSFQLLTRTDVTTTVHLVRELEATNLAESIATQIESLANRKPWELRFWLKEALARGGAGPAAGVVVQTSFAKGSPHVRLGKDALPDTAYDFVGVVKDVDAGRREYRIYVEVVLQGESYAFSSDKRHQESLLGGMNADTSRLDKRLEDVAPNSKPTDQLIDQIKEKAAAPPADGVDQQFGDLLRRLDTDKKIFEGSSQLPPEPTGIPSVPRPPRREDES